MGSSAKTGKKFPQVTGAVLDKTVIWDKTPPAIHQLQCICVGEDSRVPNLQKKNSIISFRSKVMAFLVILLSPWSLRGPRHPHIVPALSPLSPHHPHSPQKVPMWSPWPRCPHPCCLHCPCHPCHPRVVPIIPTSSRRSPDHSQSPR